MTRNPAAAQVLRKALSDLADSATRGVTGRTKGLAEEMAIINPAYGGALDALAEVEQGDFFVADRQDPAAATNLAYEFSIVRDSATEYGQPRDVVEALDKIEETHRRMHATLEDIAAGRRKFDLTPSGEQFDFVESFWFLVKLAERVVGDA